MITISQSIQSYINAMVEDIKAAAPVSSGELRNSIKADIVLTENSYEVNILMNYYGDFLDKGVNGIGPATPKSKRGVVTGSPYSFKKMIPSSAFSKYTSSLSGQFAMARSVARNGIVARNFIEPNVDPKLEGLANLTAEEIWDNFAEEQNKKDINK